jgi:hypothetical protein
MMSEHQKEIIKWITKPIWSPTIVIYKTMKNVLALTCGGFVKHLKDKDGSMLWFGFFFFAMIVLMYTVLGAAMNQSFKMSLTVYISIMLPIYLALYYIREYFKRQ